MVGCFNSGEINGTGGIIKTPNYPSYYPGNTRCTWKIRVPDGLSVRLEINDFSLYGCSGCSCDFLEIYDGSSESALTFIRMCTNSDNLFYCSGQVMYVVFWSNTQNPDKGFMASFRALPVSRGIWSLRVSVIYSEKSARVFLLNISQIKLIRSKKSKRASDGLVSFFINEPNNKRFLCRLLQKLNCVSHRSSLVRTFSQERRPKNSILVINLVVMGFQMLICNSVHFRTTGHRITNIFGQYKQIIGR